MNDCRNADIRDRLPDLVGGMLPPADAAEVGAHVDDCEDCRLEVSVIRNVRALIWAATPPVSVERISAAIMPARRRSRPVFTAAWRIAAVLTVAVLGGSVLRNQLTHGTEPAPSAVAASAGATPVVPAASASASAGVDAAAPVGTDIDASPAGLVAESGAGGGTGAGEASSEGALSEDALAALINDIENVPAIPLAEPPQRRVPAGSAIPVVLPDSLLPGIGSGSIR